MPVASEPDTFLGVATALGRQIADSATWFEGRCGWMGAVTVEDARSVRSQAVHAAIGPDLYAGTSGVALFLAETARLGDDGHLEAASLGAIRHALAHAERIPPESHDGLYGGPLGIAYAAARVGRLLDAESALAGARQLIAAWRRGRVPTGTSDIVSGCAGAVNALVALAGLLEDPTLVETASALGDELIARAEVSPAGWSWPAPRNRTMHNLCGFSHGAAGIGHALGELYGVTEEVRFRRAAERAFDYERSWFDCQTAAWPDLRGVARRVPPDAPLPTAGSWCHGAPGIALSRLRANQLLGPGEHSRDGELALEATRRLVSELLSHVWGDFSLCHGAAGVADVLVYGADASGAAPDEWSGLARELGRLGIERHHRPGPGFPCGDSQGEFPGLFQGLAGIGMFYLRLDRPGVATPLLVTAAPGFDTCHDRS